MWSQEDLDTWIDVLEHVVNEACSDAETVKTAPHRQVTAQIDPAPLDDPVRCATTWRAYRRKRGAIEGGVHEAPEHGHGAGQAPPPFGG